MIETPRYQELQQRLENQVDEKGRIEVLFEIAEELKSFDVDRAMQIADDIIQRAKTVAYPRWLGRGLSLKGSCYYLSGDYDEGLAVLKEALAMAVKTKYLSLESSVLYNLGNIYKDMGDLPKMLTHFEKALAIAESLEDEILQSEILTSISNLLYDLNDFDTALEYALKSLPIFEKGHNTSSLVNIYNTLGNIYFKKEQYQEALKYFEGILQHSELGTPPHIMAESGLGKVYYRMHRFDKANVYLISSLRNAQETGNIEVQIIAHFYLGRLFMDAHNYSRALRSLNIAYKIASENNRKHDLMSIHEVLSELYDLLKDIPNAYHHLKTLERLKEEIFKQKIINELRNMQIRQQVELANKEKEVAENTALLKHQFMANMSHEIRTPMNAIVGMTRLLQINQPRPDQQKYLNAIQQSASNLLVIVNDILDLSKIEAGKIILEQIDFSINEVLQGINDMLLFKAEEKKIAFKLSSEGDIPKRLIGDPTRLNQILLNLAGNAVKFTDKGYVEIKSILRKRDNDKLWLQFDIVDTGIGIAAEYIDKIFDNFTQAGTDVSRKFGGTGLGLAISRQLVSLMHGDISVKSELGKGTTFSVIIPFLEAEEQEYVAITTTIDEVTKARLSQLRVLLAEDNELNRIVAIDTIEDLLPGIKIDIAVNGQEAVNGVRDGAYDIVLMDIQMPIMDGLTATQTIRNTLKKPKCDTKIIAMTANVLQEDVKNYLDAGMDAYVSKPFNPEELLIKMFQVTEGLVLGATEDTQTNIAADNLPVLEMVPIEEPLNIPNSTGKAPEKAAEPDPIRIVIPASSKININYEETPPPPPPVAEISGRVTDKNFLVKLTNGNPEKMKKYINMFLENAPKLLDSIDKGMASKDYVAVKIAAHSLKPQLSYMGVKEDVSHIFLIEQSAGESAHYDSLPARIEVLKAVCLKAFEELRQY